MTAPSQPAPQNENIKINEDGTISPIDPSKPTYFSTEPPPEDEELRLPKELDDLLYRYRQAARNPETVNKIMFDIEAQILAWSESHADQDKAAAYLKGQLNVLYSLENKLAVGGWNIKYVVQEKIGELKPKLAELQNRDKMSPPLQDGGSTV